MFRNTDIWMKHICCLHSHNHLTSQKTRSISLSSSDCDRSLDFSQLKSIPEAAFLSLCRTDLCTGPCTGSHIAGEMFVKIGRKSEGLGQVLGVFFCILMLASNRSLDIGHGIGYYQNLIFTF